MISHQREHSTTARLVGLNGARDSKVRGRIARLADGRIGRFGWKSEFATLGDFVKAACANEPRPLQPRPRPATPLGKRDYQATGTDLTDEQCVLMTDFIRGLPAPTQVLPDDPELASRSKSGRDFFETMGARTVTRNGSDRSTGSIPICLFMTWALTSCRASGTTT